MNSDLFIPIMVGIIVSIATYFITRSFKRMEQAHNSRETAEDIFRQRICAIESICRDLLYSRIRQVYAASLRKKHITLDDLREVIVLVKALEIIDDADLPKHMLDKLKSMPQGDPPNDI